MPVLAANHVHPLVLWTVSLVMQRAGRYFVRDINRVYRRGGTLWKGRFKADI